jgi:hypothetical protein
LVGEKVEESSLFAEFVKTSIQRHATGDWGDLSKKDKLANEVSVEKGLSTQSNYLLPLKLKNIHEDERIWIMTEDDRSETIIFFPSELLTPKEGANLFTTYPVKWSWSLKKKWNQSSKSSATRKEGNGSKARAAIALSANCQPSCLSEPTHTAGDAHQSRPNRKATAIVTDFRHRKPTPRSPLVLKED